ncbi:MAG TPA: Ig-like domain-containing protein, partial [Mycobacteriales bacterium]
ATGTVTFTSGGAVLCTATLPATSCATAAELAPGSHPVTATYPGDTHYVGSSASTTFDVTKATTSLTAGVASPSVAYGSAETLSHSGLPSGATGTVRFVSGGTTLCTATLPDTSCTSPADLTAGAYPVTATYSGDGNHQGTSDTTSFTVAKRGASGFAASAIPASTVYGVADTLSFTGLAAGATGTVRFVSGGTTLCTATLPEASCSAPADLDTATYPVTATYSGDANHDGSSDAASFTVTKAVTALNASPGSENVTFGTPQTLSYDGLPVGAAGTVRFVSGGTTLCTATLPATSCSAPADLTAGAYPVTATYSGDANHVGSSDAASFTVTKRGASGFAASATPVSTVYGVADTLSFTGLAAGATGTVRFVSGGTALCTATLPATSCSAPADLDTGTYPVTATYSGDADHQEASDTTSFGVVKAASPIGAEVGATSAPEGDRVVLTATGLPAGAAGTVTFSAGGEVLCGATLPATSCSTSSALSPGSYRVTARYSGDANHQPSTATTALVITAVEKVTRTTSSSGGATTSTPIPGADTARSVQITGEPAHGAATIVNGRVVYTPDHGFVGTDTVTVRVVDADGTVRVVTVEIRVAAAARARAVLRLPSTGAAVIAPAVIGATLLLVGSAAVWATRRRRTR